MPSNTSYFQARNVGHEYYKDYRIPRYLLACLPTRIDAPILDIGCGFGQTLLALRTLGYTNLAGIDVSDEAVNHCRSKGLAVSKVSSIVDYCRWSGSAFDFIVMSHVLEHIEKNEIVVTLRHIREHLLADGGAFCVMVPNAQSNTGCYWAYEDFTHTTLFTAGSLFYVLRSAGFESVEFLDPDGTAASNMLVNFSRKLLLRLFRANRAFWNLVTSSSYHEPSPQIFTYEIKALAKSGHESMDAPKPGA